jgi:hypothetical protein
VTAWLVPALDHYDRTHWVEVEDRTTNEVWRVTLDGWVSPAMAWRALGARIGLMDGETYINANGKLAITHPDPYDVDFDSAATAGDFGYNATHAAIHVGGTEYEADNALTAYEVSHISLDSTGSARGSGGFNGGAGCSSDVWSGACSVAGTPAQIAAVLTGLETYPVMGGAISGIELVPINLYVEQTRVRFISNDLQIATLTGRASYVK